MSLNKLTSGNQIKSSAGATTPVNKQGVSGSTPNISFVPNVNALGLTEASKYHSTSNRNSKASDSLLKDAKFDFNISSVSPVDHTQRHFLASTEAPERIIYMDYQATTPVDERVIKKMLPTFRADYGNAHSRTHAFGWTAEKMTDDARGNVAELIGAQQREVIFTSGATESNNLAIKGACQYYGRGVEKPHFITAQTEHKCVLASAQYLEHELGWDVTYLPVDSEGLIDVEEFRKAITPNTVMCSIMTVNNEIGTIQPIKDLVSVCREKQAEFGGKRIIFHTDAAQAIGKIPFDVNDLDVDLVSISGHKIYGPKGIGALYVRGSPKIRLVPQMHGGGQERGLRSGTLPVSLCVGFGEACKIATQQSAEDYERIKRLSDKLVESITSRLTHVTINGGKGDRRFPGVCNISFAGVEGESLIMAVKEVAVSSGSACTSASLEPSYVLRALGVDEELAHTSLRFGIGRETTEEDITRVADVIVDAVQRLRSVSILWEMLENGTSGDMVWT